MPLTFDDFDIGDKIQCDHDKNIYEVVGKCKGYTLGAGGRDVVFCPHNGVTFDFDIKVLNSLNTRIVHKANPKTPVKQGCTCDTLVVCNYGCKCGAFQQEQKQKP